MTLRYAHLSVADIKGAVERIGSAMAHVMKLKACKPRDST